MPLYTRPYEGLVGPLSLREFEPTWGDSLAVGWRTGWRYNPMRNLYNMAKARGALDWEWESDADLVELAGGSGDDGWQAMHDAAVAEREAQARAVLDITRRTVEVMGDPDEADPAARLYEELLGGRPTFRVEHRERRLAAAAQALERFGQGAGGAAQDQAQAGGAQDSAAQVGGAAQDLGSQDLAQAGGAQDNGAGQDLAQDQAQAGATQADAQGEELYSRVAAMLDEPDNLPFLHAGVLQEQAELAALLGDVPRGTSAPADHSADRSDDSPGALPLAEQRKLIEEAGLEDAVKPDPGYTREVLDFILQDHAEDRADQIAVANAPWHHFIPALGGNLAAGLSDPLMLASCFIPGVNAARGASMIARAGTTLGRLWARARIGAVNGAVGAAVLEPLVWGGQSALQKDYTCFHSLLNVSFGAALGATLHPLAGLLSDARAARLAPSPEIQSRLNEHRDAFATALARSDPSLSPEQVASQANALAAAWHGQASFIARQSGLGIDEFYRQVNLNIQSNSFELRAMPANTLEQVMQDVETGARLAQGLPESSTLLLPDPDGRVLAAIDLAEGQTLFRLYQGADAETSLAGILAIGRDRLERAARSPAASPALRQVWQGIEEACAIPPGQGWTDAAIRTFTDNALASLRNQPSHPAFAPLVADLRAYLAKGVSDAAASGLTLPQALTQSLDDMFALPLPEANQRLSSMIRRLEDPGTDLLADPPGALAQHESQSGASLRLYDEHGRVLDDPETLARITQEDQLQLQSAYEQLAQEHPDLANAMLEQANAELAAANSAIDHARTRGQMMQDYAQCILG